MRIPFILYQRTTSIPMHPESIIVGTSRSVMDRNPVGSDDVRAYTLD